MKAKISYNIPNRGWAHIHAHTVDIIEHAVVFVVGDLVTLRTSDRPHREVIRHRRVCGSTDTWPKITKRCSITLCSSDHMKNQFTCVHLCTCVDYWSNHIASLCPWGTRFADDHKAAISEIYFGQGLLSQVANFQQASLHWSLGIWGRGRERLLCSPSYRKAINTVILSQQA